MAGCRLVIGVPLRVADRGGVRVASSTTVNVARNALAARPTTRKVCRDRLRGRGTDTEEPREDRESQRSAPELKMDMNPL